MDVREGETNNREVQQFQPLQRKHMQSAISIVSISTETSINILDWETIYRATRAEVVLISDVKCVDISHTSKYMSRFVSVGDALERERPATMMSSYFAGHSGCKVT